MELCKPPASVQSHSCGQNNLEMNELKTERMTVDFRRRPPSLPPSPYLTALSAVETFKSLHNLQGAEVGLQHQEEGPAEVDLLHQLRKFTLPRELLVRFYFIQISSSLLSVLQAVRGLDQVCRGDHGSSLPCILDLYRVRKQGRNHPCRPSHRGHNLSGLLPSRRRYRALHAKTTRHKLLLRSERLSGQINHLFCTITTFCIFIHSIFNVAVCDTIFTFQ